MLYSFSYIDSQQESPLNLEPPFKPSTFDKILLDPPCSGLGNRPQLSCTMTEKEMRSYPIYQRKLIKQVRNECFTSSN